MRYLAIAAVSLLLAASAHARETDHLLSIEEDMNSELGREKLFDVPVYFHDQPHPKVKQEISVERSNRHTRGVFRSDRNSCRVAFLSALRELQVRAQKSGADGIIGIRSVTRHKNHESATEYRCIAGATVAHVGLEGTLVRFGE